MVITSRARLLVVCAMLSLPPVDGELAADPQIKPPIRGLVSMGAYRFVGKGGDPVNTLEPLNAKPGIFGGLVIIATWKQLQPTPDSEIGETFRAAFEQAIDVFIAEDPPVANVHDALGVPGDLGLVTLMSGGFEVPDWAMRSAAARRSPPCTTAGSVSSAHSGAPPIGRRGRDCRSSLPPSTTAAR